MTLRKRMMPGGSRSAEESLALRRAVMGARAAREARRIDEPEFASVKS